MHVCTLQFEPKIGQVAANTVHADELLAAIEPGSLDLLVLPELAFTGYNFPNLLAIKPYLESTGNGPTARWAAATAARLGCIVIAGYPETTSDHTVIPKTVTSAPSIHADLSSSAPPPPMTRQYNFNSNLTVSPDGTILAHYRKTLLYYTDATWALPSPFGFSTVPLPLSPPFPVHTPDSPSQLRSPSFSSTISPPSILASYAICMDLNPSFFTAPWSTYELATHTLSTRADVLLGSMAWVTHLTRAELDEEPTAPDWDTLSYWVERLRPLLEAERETLVVIGNRVGVEPGGIKALDLEKVTGGVWAREGANSGGGAVVGAVDTGGLTDEMHATAEKRRRKEELEEVRGAEPVTEKDDGLADGESRYAGTSCVMGLGKGKVRCWGIMGRAEEGLLVADTKEPPVSVWVLKNNDENGDGDDGTDD